jgi:dTDP-4-dehydrorhamnose 3,5-epimerase
MRGHLLQKLATALPDVWELRPSVFRDARGFFIESYNQAAFAAAGITEIFVQDNHSCSVRGTLRGLHYQLHRPQAKLCRVVEGEALDVAVDIRAGSPTFRHWAGVVLSASAMNQIYIPRGFAHGFLALTERVQFLYKCSALYDAADEHAILWSDPRIGISWNIAAPLVSEKDRKALALAQMPRELLPVYSAI